MQTNDGNASVVGDECHIIPRSKTGPRADPLVRQDQLDEYQNLILLCKIHHKIVDDLPDEYSIEKLHTIKQSHEERVERVLGFADQALSAEEEIKRKLSLRRRMQKELVIHNQIGLYPYSKFECPNIIIHSIDDMTYGHDDYTLTNESGYSSWFKLEIWDLYHDGVKTIIGIDCGILDSEGNWAVLDYKQQYDRQSYVKIKMFRLGCIPFRNIVDFDTYGDEFYPVPHFYCRFSDNGGPFSELEWVLFEREEKSLIHAKNTMNRKRKFDLLG